VLDALDVVDPLPAEVDGSDDHAGGTDPHVWLDPLRLAAIAAATADALGDIDPANGQTFRENAEAYAAELEALDAEMREGLASCSSRLLVVSHAAFGYLADAYDLEQESIAGISPEVEPDPARLAELDALVREEGVTTIFTETLASPDVARTLADEAGVTTAVLNPLEGLTPEELGAGEDYGSIMRANLQTLRGALVCA
jgi:zinc transport system substrate-binding protein